MFFPRSAPLALTGNDVRGLRLSLNTPVVATEELPIGPARAAILVHDEPDGSPQVTIGIRSLRSGRTALYGFEGDLREASSFAVAVDGALSFAESMGFLFDEDELGAGGAVARARCLGLWHDLLGEEGATPMQPPVAPAPEPADELLLEELADDAAAGDPTDEPVFLSGDDVSLPPHDPSGFGGITDVYVPQFDGDLGADPSQAGPEIGSRAFDPESGQVEAAAPELDDETSFADVLDPSDETAAEPPKPPPPARAQAGASPVSLTKFRGRSAAPAPQAAPAKADAPVAPAAPAAPAAPTSAQRATALGKLRLVRRLRGGGRRRHPILRLFGSF